MNFALLQQRLVSLIQDRVRSGEITERGLARLTGLSQPHVHNVLKGVRRLSPETADHLLDQFRITILDLMPGEEIRRQMGPDNGSFRLVPCLRDPIGPGNTPGKHAITYLPVPAARLDDVDDPVIAELADDGHLPSPLREGDWVLLDRGSRVRQELSEGIYLLELSGQTLLRRMLRAGSGEIVLPCDPISFADHDILDVVKGKVVWFGRRLEQVRN
jgi:hypothetical protein